MLVLVRDDDFDDDDTFVLLVVSNRKFQQFQSNNARAKSLSDSNALLPLSGRSIRDRSSFSRSSTTSSTFLHFA